MNLVELSLNYLRNLRCSFLRRVSGHPVYKKIDHDVLHLQSCKENSRHYTTIWIRTFLFSIIMKFLTISFSKKYTLLISTSRINQCEVWQYPFSSQGNPSMVENPLIMAQFIINVTGLKYGRWLMCFCWRKDTIETRWEERWNTWHVHFQSGGCLLHSWSWNVVINSLWILYGRICIEPTK